MTHKNVQNRLKNAKFPPPPAPWHPRVQSPHAQPCPRRHPPRRQHQKHHQRASQIARTQATRPSKQRRHRHRLQQATRHRQKADSRPRHRQDLRPADTHHKRARPLRVGADGLARKAVKLQVVGIGPGPAEVRYTASRAPAVNQEIEGTLCGLHIASLPQIIV